VYISAALLLYCQYLTDASSMLPLLISRLSTPRVVLLICRLAVWGEVRPQGIDVIVPARGRLGTLSIVLTNCSLFKHARLVDRSIEHK